MEFKQDHYAGLEDGSLLCEHDGEIFVIEGEVSAPAFEDFTDTELQMLKEPDYIPF
jgi:hypothetical protein